MKFVFLGGGTLNVFKAAKSGQERVREKYEWNYSFSHKFELAFNFNFRVCAFFDLICAIVASPQHKSKEKI